MLPNTYRNALTTVWTDKLFVQDYLIGSRYHLLLLELLDYSFNIECLKGREQLVTKDRPSNVHTNS
jgi:hypothetical protein